MNSAIPTTLQERIHLLDIIRGFALLGILLMNIEFFQRPLLAMMNGFNTEQSGLDYATAWGVYTFVQGKFYTMFSLLFGMGFVLFLDRALAKSSKPRLLFFRRILVLGIFGALHISLLWSGDILLNYAIVGLFLLLFVNTTAKRLWKWGAALIIIPVGFFWLGAWGIQFGLNSPEGPVMLADIEAQREAIEQTIASGHQIYAQGSYAEVLAYRLNEVALLYGGGGIVFFVPIILGTVLIGAAFARAGIFTRANEHRKALRNMLLFGLLIGVPSALFIGFRGLNFDMMLPDYRGALIFTLQTVANVALCFAYMAAIALAYLNGKRWLQYLAPAGRMALTNYLMHSIVFTTLFYSYGFGLYGEFGRFATTLMVFAVYGVQLWFSAWWLKRYQYGPMEWLWRSATYLQLQPMRKRTAVK